MKLRATLLSIALALCGALAAASAKAPRAAATLQPDRITAMTASEMARAMAAGQLTSEAIVRAELARIAAVDGAGPRINSVIATFPDAVEQARQRDAERRAGRVRGVLHGIPVLLKDNIEAAGPVPTSAGSLALAQSITGRDAPLVARLRAAGAVILGKTNLSEWANFRSEKSTSGWSAVGGLTRNPWMLDRNACGSSSGSGAAVAAFLAPLAVGTETDGSITCPAAINGDVGFKPSVGLVSRRYIVPISHSQDTAGPMTRSVEDAARLLLAMAGSDPADPATREADAHVAGLSRAFAPGGLIGVRIGVLRDEVGKNAKIAAAFEQALAAMRRAGATIVDIPDSGEFEGLGEAEFTVLLTEFKADMAGYLADLPPGRVAARSLADLIAFNQRESARELRHFDQGIFEQAEKTQGLSDPAYQAALAKARRLAGPEGIDRLLRDNRVDLLVQPSNGPAWRSTLGQGDKFSGPSASRLPAIAGYPHLTVPAGLVDGLPVGVSFIGTRWDDARVLAAGRAYEIARGPFARPRYLSAARPAQPSKR